MRKLSKAEKPLRSGKSADIFSGKIVCAHCGFHMRIRTERKIHRMKCKNTTLERGEGCYPETVEMTEIEELSHAARIEVLKKDILEQEDLLSEEKSWKQQKIVSI